MSKQTMGEFLATLRKANGYTQQEVAEKLNVSNKTMSSWETDRTVPDLLIMPAIADLYGVTVDEIVRGERIAEKNERAEISEKSFAAVRKNRFGKFSARCALLTGLALLCASLFVVSGIVATLTNSPLVLDIILLILTAAGFVTCIVLLFYFLYATKSAEGIVLSEDLTEDKKAFMLALKHKAAKFLAINSLPFIVGALVFLFIHVAHSTEIAYFYGILVSSSWLTVICICALVALLVAALIYGNLNFTKLANENQLKIHKTNKKYASILLPIGASFNVLTIIIIIICAIIDEVFYMVITIPVLLGNIILPAVCAIIYFAIRKKQNYNF